MKQREIVRLGKWLPVLLILASNAVCAQLFRYPEARKDSTVDIYHGVPVADPYRWMEIENTPELNRWIDGQNALTNTFVSAFAGRDVLKRRLVALWNYERTTVPYKRGGKYFFAKNNGLQNQDVLYVKTSLDAEPRLVLDPNALSEDGSVALVNEEYSFDGTLMAYGFSKSGSDQKEIRIRNVLTGKEYDEVLRWATFGSMAWSKDGKGFYYNRYPDPASVPAGEGTLNNKVYWHEPGTPQSSDRLVLERPDARELAFAPASTDDGEYVILHVWRGTDRENRIYYRSMNGTGPFVRLLDSADARYGFVDNVGQVFYFNTDLNAPRGRIVAIDTRRPKRDHWKEIIPEQKEPIAFATAANNHLVVAYMKDARHILRLFTMEGKFVREIILPVLGTITGISGQRTEKELFLGLTSFLYPTTIFSYDFSSGQLSLFVQPKLDFPADRYVTEQVFYSSKDGTKIPMFLTHKKGLLLDGGAPMLLYGYGGFQISLTPSFKASRLLWLEAGGVYASANIRGGSEYGEEWHQAGALEKKQNVFDDFIAAAEWLVRNRYTKTSRLAIMGGSNGGLLVAACMLQRPDLFGAVLCEVPVTDMLRYHRFTVGRFWTGDYGNAEENPEHFRFLKAYSPLHNVIKGVPYPPTLILTADHDDRVVPAHALKFGAALQSADAGKNPILLRIETKAGHGGGKPVSKQIEEAADMYAFLLRVFGMSMP